jgi:multidrug transporter EmrE-like cation transporter
MNTTKFLGIALLVAGVLGLVYGGFSYTKDTTAVKLGPIELTVKEKQSVNIPLWAGIASIVAGGALLALGGKGR